MQIILKEDVKSLGKKGTIVKVNDNYARNYIIPKGLGVEANKANLNDLKLKNANEAKIEAAKTENANITKAAIDGKKITIKVKGGKDGKLFGSVTSKEVAEAINSAYKVDVDKKRISMEPIKTPGETQVIVKLHRDINAKVNVEVITE